MKSPSALFDLVHSLSASEKGYFKKYATLHGAGIKKYVKLFDAINAQKQYDEEKLKKKFKKELSNLSAAKNYLFEEVLEATRVFQINYSHASQILRLTDQADLLFKRGLHEVARDKYAEAYQKAVSIFSYKHAILPRWGFIQCCYHTRLEPLLPTNEMIALNNKILDETWLNFGHGELGIMKAEYSAQIGNPQTKRMLDEMKAAELAHIKLVKERTGDSVLGRSLYHCREMFYALENQNRLQTLKHSLSAIQIFLESPLLKIADPENYFTMLLNLLVGYTVVFMEPERRLLSAHIKQESARLKPSMSRQMQLQVESSLYNSAIIDHMRNRPLSEVDKLFKEEILPWFKESKKRLKAYDASRFMLWYMEHLFRKGDYRELLFRCNEFLYDKSVAYPQYPRACVLLIYLIVYLEQGDWNILPAKLKESYRLLKQENTTNEAVLLVISLVGKVIKEKKEFELKPTLQKLRNEMAERTINKETGIIEVFSPFHFEAWIESKLEVTSHQTVASRFRALKRKKVIEKFDEELKMEGLIRHHLRLPFMT